MAGRLRVWLVLAGLSAAGIANTAQAQTAATEGAFYRSYSGQFVVRVVRRPYAPLPAVGTGTNLSLIRLTPALLPVSCERIRQILWRELGVQAAWQGKVNLNLYPGAGAGEEILLASDRFRDGWQYQLVLPDLVDRTRYVRAMVRVLLLEIANRQSRSRGAEIPYWLVEGLTRQLLASSEVQILLPPPRPGAETISLSPTVVSGLRENPLEEAHHLLSAGPPLSFYQLSWPTVDQMEGAGAEFYRCNAQLFLNELTGLKDGRARLAAMLGLLPEHLNWQLAFLKAFQADFQRPLDVEKWWMLHAANFTGRDLSQMWSVEQSWQKLEQVIRSPFAVRSDTNDLPMSTEASLQTIVRDWAGPRQAAVLQEKIHELDALRLRLAPTVVPSLDDYRQALQQYVLQYDKAGGLIPFRKKAAQRRLQQETVNRLDLIDARRKALHPLPQPPNRPAETAQNPA